MIAVTDRPGCPVPLAADPAFDALYLELGDHAMGYLAAESIPQGMFAGERWIRMLCRTAEFQAAARRVEAVAR